MVVQLIQSDIDNGIPGDCLRDPIAIALRRITGKQWRVDKQIIAPYVKGCKPFVTPRAASRFIEAIDDGKQVQPIRFELR